MTTKHSIDRDQSLIAFNVRVLALARQRHVPLLERLRYLCIVSRNVDEFFEVRVAELLTAIESNGKSSDDLVTLQSRYADVTTDAHALVESQYELLNDQLIPELKKNGIRLLSHRDRNTEQTKWVEDYFLKEVLPLLTPIGLDPSHPFPQVANKSLNFIVELGSRKEAKKTRIMIVRVPRSLPRVVELPNKLCGKYRGFLLLTSIIRANLSLLFSGYRLRGYSQFRTTRNSDLWLDESDVHDLRTALRSKLTTRSFGRAVRLEVSATCPENLAQFLQQHFALTERDTYRVPGPVNLVRLDELVDLATAQKFRYDVVAQRSVDPGFNRDPFSALRDGDLLLHHPFDSFQPVLDFLGAAAIDPSVAAIKITVYRTGADSAIMQSLMLAARRGVDVTVVLELRARFDEETNIDWAEQLERVGVQVIYGVFGLKTHAKMCLVTRREAGRLVNYVHLGTGNYNASTTKRYTDFGLLTSRLEICQDVSTVFRCLASATEVPSLDSLWVAPTSLLTKLLHAIKLEANEARAGRRGRIVAKMNSLVEPQLVEALYAASNAGVRIDLIVRGACTLRPGVVGLSENIKVRSIVGRFLEHSRIYCFFNAGKPKVYLSSADWMGRNLLRRIEVAFPVLDESLAYRVVAEGIEPYLRDPIDAWDLGADGRYVKAASVEPNIASAQEYLLAMISTPSS